jgi:hypothetical protein
MTGKTLQVEQVDRDAAADRLQAGRSAISTYEAATIQKVRAGSFDHHPWVQAFAKHRLDALANLPTNSVDVEQRARPRTSFEKTLDKLTREAIEESLADIAKAFDALFSDRDEWKQQHENLLEVRQQDLFALSGPRLSNEGVREALIKCRDQFAFYAREHTAAGKLEKAATNQRFADMATQALASLQPASLSEERMAPLLDAIDAWAIDPTADKEQAILDARATLARGKKNG